MRGVRRATLWALVCLAVAFIAGPAVGAPKLAIDHVDASGFAKKKQLVIHFDLLDGSSRVVKKLSAKSVRVLIDGKPVKGKLSLSTAGQAGVPVSVALLVAGHLSYANIPPEDEDGKPLPAGPNFFAAEKDGFMRFLRKLKAPDQVGVYLYDSRLLKRLLPLTEGSVAAAKVLASKAKVETLDDQDGATARWAPTLFKHLEAVMESAFRGNDELHRRRVLVVMSDGKDRHAARGAKTAERKIVKAVEIANDLAVKVHAVGFTPDDPDPLVNLSSFATRTGGTYREVAYPETEAGEAKLPELIASAVEGVAVDMKNQYVLTFQPAAGFKAKKGPVTVRLEVKTPSGKAAAGEAAHVKLR